MGAPMASGSSTTDTTYSSPSCSFTWLVCPLKLGASWVDQSSLWHPLIALIVPVVFTVWHPELIGSLAIFCGNHLADYPRGRLSFAEFELSPVANIEGLLAVGQPVNIDQHVKERTLS